VAEGWAFRRGFVEHITLTGQAFLAHAERLFASEAIRHVHLSLRPGDVTALAGCAELRRVETLAFERCHLSGAAFQRVLASPHLLRLTALTLPAGVEVPGVRALTESGVLARLTELDFGRNPAFGDRAARLLAQSPAVQQLRVLRLAETNLTPDGVQALLASPHLIRLTTLDLVGADRSPPTRDLTPVAVQLAASPLLARLTKLDLSGHRFGLVGFRILLHSPNLATLRALSLRRVAPVPQPSRTLILRKMAESPHLAGLTALDLRNNRINDEGLQALAESPHLANLSVLRLGGNVFQDAGAQALASSAHLRRLAVLDLSGNGIGGPGLEALADSEILAQVTDLNLASNFIGVASVQTLTRSPRLARLAHLDLSQNQLQPDSARVLAGSPNLTRLRTLALSSNRLGNEGAAALAAAPHLPRLATLRLDNNGIGKNGAEALADSPYLGRLLRLEVRGNVFTDDERRRLRARFGSRVVF
jgi:Ran GTPase-activating protein (RanGAP) involved in mRNA processing and transport